MKAPGNAFTAPSLPRVLAAPAPPQTAPIITKIEQMMAAVENVTILVPTAVPNTLAATIAPNAHPKNRPLLKNMRTLHIRMKQHSHNAQFIAEHFLREGIKVYYPGIKSHPQFSLI